MPNPNQLWRSSYGHVCSRLLPLFLPLAPRWAGQKRIPTAFPRLFVLEPFFPVSRGRRVFGPFSVFMVFVAKMALRAAAKCLSKIAQMGLTSYRIEVGLPMGGVLPFVHSLIHFVFIKKVRFNKM